MYLVDTNVISALAPERSAPAKLKNWLTENTDRLFLSVITIAEIQDGIAKAWREGASRKAADLTAWLETILHLYASRIITFDVATARFAGALSDRARGLGIAPGFADIAIAATAQSNGLTILTRNLRHFTPLGVVAVDPFMQLPG